MATRSRSGGHPVSSEDPENKSTAEVNSPDKSPRGSGDTERENTKSASPEPNCAICLGKLENKSFTDSCFHTFCFVCLLEWSKVQAVCPLCKQAFKSIIHNVRSFEDYDQYHLRNEENAAAELENRRFRFHTTMTNERWWEQQRREQERQMELLQRPTRMSIATQWRRQRQAATSGYRRRIYADEMRVTEVRTATGRTMRYREVSPQFYRQNPACTHRLVPWLNRELTVLLLNQEDHIQFVLELIIDLIKRFDIQSEEFSQHIQPFTGRRTEHFIHEFYSFARSPYDMFAYDQRAIYVEPAEQPVHTIESSDSFSDQSDDAEIIEHVDENDDVIVVSPTEPLTLPADEATTSQDHPYSSMFSTGADNFSMIPPPLRIPVDFDLAPLFRRVQNFISSIEHNPVGAPDWDTPRPGPSTASSSREGTSTEPIILDPPPMPADQDIPLPPSSEQIPPQPPLPQDPSPLPVSPEHPEEQASVSANSGQDTTPGPFTSVRIRPDPDPVPVPGPSGVSGNTFTSKLEVPVIKKERMSSESDSDSSDVVVIGFTKPWEDRSPEAVSTEDEMEALAKIEAAKIEDERYKKQLQEKLKREAEESDSRSYRSRTRSPRRHRRRSRSSSRANHRRRSRSRSRRSRSRSRRSRSRIRRSRSRSRLRRSRSRSRRSKSRSRRSGSRTSRRRQAGSRDHRSQATRSSRSRSRSPRHRTTQEYSSHSRNKDKHRDRHREQERERSRDRTRERDSEKARRDWERMRERDKRKLGRSRSRSHETVDRPRKRNKRSSRSSSVSRDHRRSSPSASSNIPKAYQIINSSRSRSRSKSVEVVFRRRHKSKAKRREKRKYSRTSKERQVDPVSPPRHRKEAAVRERSISTSSSIAASQASTKQTDRCKKNPTGHKKSSRKQEHPRPEETARTSSRDKNEAEKISSKQHSSSKTSSQRKDGDTHVDKPAATEVEHSSHGNRKRARHHHVISDDEEDRRPTPRGYSMVLENITSDSSDCEIQSSSAGQVYNYDHRTTSRRYEHERLHERDQGREYRREADLRHTLDYNLSREEREEIDRIAYEMLGHRPPYQRSNRDPYWDTSSRRY